jgi:hypothetical protein
MWCIRHSIQHLSEEETKLLLEGVPFGRIPGSVKRKLERFKLTARDYGLLPRNIKAVLR